MRNFINKKRFKVITTLNLNFLLSIEKTLQCAFIETPLQNFQFSIFSFQFYRNAAICSCNFLASSAAFSAKSCSFEA